ncbi:deaminase [Ktedonosporobacter rubrisoli]|uniref:Deaminase n=1 Tax=Ktedonosporobacter rubrisoli TaxID=2509675 RepID=A0A4P6JK34_KTERU|nr:dihydrofolate reductase family protein [Ktedonosporobacter rubrisoli]QBD75508.1 deaminase [Ktedonosporobacter rubrisoli]
MGKIATEFSMSLDGFVAGPNDEVEQVFKWMMSGDTEITAVKGDGDIELKVPEESASIFEEDYKRFGVIVAGRRIFDMTHGWGGKHPMDVPIIVVTHQPPPEWCKPEWPVTFVHDGLESALALARKIAGEKDVAIASTTLVQQCLKAGWLDEILVDLVPFLLGKGVRLFAELDAPLEMEIASVVPSKGVTHITYRINK